ncbi:MAG: HAD-IA family hydrolase, partial [Thermodesulfovibrionia bacterium]|nr:HAD-IA family hydrolase [Thermodesulfovibrionia bacterium]
LDGTLLDTSKDITNAVNYAMEPFGVQPLSIETIKSMVGSGISNLIGELISPYVVSQDNISFLKVKEEAVKRFLEHYSVHLLDNTIPYPGVKDTLSKFVHYKKAVLSNKRKVFSEKILHERGLSTFFDVILGSDSMSERKPSPVPIFEVLKKFHASKSEAVIIGDSNFDIEAGKAAGIKTIAVTYGYRGREVLKEADFIIDTFGELLHLLQEINKNTG